MRYGFKMKLNPGRADEYRKRHDNIWPELKQLLSKSGIRNYSIFLDEETNILFGYLEMENRAAFDQLPNEAIMKKWWNHMKDIMETHPDNSPTSRPLTMVFQMD